jgi:hypothetical protein
MATLKKKRVPCKSLILFPSKINMLQKVWVITAPHLEVINLDLNKRGWNTQNLVTADTFLKYVLSFHKKNT